MTPAWQLAENALPLQVTGLAVSCYLSGIATEYFPIQK